jgi:hypothetical protein
VELTQIIERASRSVPESTLINKYKDEGLGEAESTAITMPIKYAPQNA